jgi:capsular polysaccharide biosynthesis protein
VRPPIGPRVQGIAERVEEVAIPGTFEVLRGEILIERRPPQTAGPGEPAVFERLRTHRHPPVFRARLLDARVVGAEPLVLTVDHEALLASTFDREQLEANPVMRRRLPRATRRQGTHLLLTNQWARNHFHWLLDTLPRAALLPLDELREQRVIVPAGLSPGQVESLERIGIDRSRLVAFDGGHLQVSELVFPSLVGGTGNPPRWALAWLRERLVPTPDETGRRLYVSRADATSRRVVNEAELVAALEPHGFERVTPGSLPMLEQLRMFAEAEVILGPHGAGMVNLMGARPGARVIELFEARYVNGCYYALADALELPYWYLVAEGSGRTDLRVDIAAVERTLAAAGLS